MASTIKVNNIQNQCGANIINESANTITIGASGDTISLAAGASQTGFGRTGTVDWNTTAITADPANAVSGTGYFADTTSAAFTITLPTSPSAGDIIAVRDYAQTFATNNLTIGRNSEPIDGIASDLILDTNGDGVTLVYVDGTQGWKSVNSNETINEVKFVAASGGTETTSGDFKIHTFTGPGTFTVSCGGNSAGSNSVSYMVIAGGGGGGGDYGGGGGAGGYREGKASTDSYTASPLNAPAGLPVTAQGYPITVGGGGSGGVSGPGGNATSGSNSVFSTITSAGGGRGGTLNGSPNTANTGGSGGGGTVLGGAAGAAGNTPPVSPPQGNNGGNGAGACYGAGGGGGAGAVGTNAIGGEPSVAGPGGAGTTSSINGTPTARAGGGGGGGGACRGDSYQPYNPGTGGSGGGGAGAIDSPNANGVAGTTNTGSGGGGGNNYPSPSVSTGGSGGSGIVIIRYKFQ